MFKIFRLILSFSYHLLLYSMSVITYNLKVNNNGSWYSNKLYAM